MMMNKENIMTPTYYNVNNSNNNNNNNIDDTHLVRDLYLSSISDSTIYSTVGQTVVQTLRRKIKNGSFKEELAPKLFTLMYLDASKKAYTKNTGVKIPRMTSNEKKLFGEWVYASFREEVMQGMKLP